MTQLAHASKLSPWLVLCIGAAIGAGAMWWRSANAKGVPAIGCIAIEARDTPGERVAASPHVVSVQIENCKDTLYSSLLVVGAPGFIWNSGVLSVSLAPNTASSGAMYSLLVMDGHSPIAMLRVKGDDLLKTASLKLGCDFKTERSAAVHFSPEVPFFFEDIEDPYVSSFWHSQGETVARVTIRNASKDSRTIEVVNEEATSRFIHRYEIVPVQKQLGDTVDFAAVGSEHKNRFQLALYRRDERCKTPEALAILNADEMLALKSVDVSDGTFRFDPPSLNANVMRMSPDTEAPQ